MIAPDPITQSNFVGHMTSGQMKSGSLKLNAAFIYYHKLIDIIV